MHTRVPTSECAAVLQMDAQSAGPLQKPVWR